MESIGQVNKYVCKQCGGVHGTINLNTGVTPMFITCQNEDCGGDAASMMYNLPRGKTGCGWAWYRPTVAEFARLDACSQELILRGQLMLGQFNQALPMVEPDYVYDAIVSRDVDRWLGYIAQAYQPDSRLFDRVVLSMKPSERGNRN